MNNLDSNQIKIFINLKIIEKEYKNKKNISIHQLRNYQRIKTISISLKKIQKKFMLV